MKSNDDHGNIIKSNKYEQKGERNSGTGWKAREMKYWADGELTVQIH